VPTARVHFARVIYSIGAVPLAKEFACRRIEPLAHRLEILRTNLAGEAK
jgi:hypothetical protein